MLRNGSDKLARLSSELIEKAKKVKVDVSFIVPLSFLLLQIFKLIDLLITNKTVENIFVIPFQLIIFLLPAYLFAKHKNKDEPLEYLLKLRLNFPKTSQIPFMLASLGLLIFGSMMISAVFAGTESLDSGFTLYNTFVSRVGVSFFSDLFLIIAYCAVPAFCEELVFRAILCREYEKYNVLLGIISSSVFFALLHFNVSQFPVYLFSGILLSLVMYATGSVSVSMIVHFAFNIFGLFGQPYLNAFYTVTGGTSGLFIFILSMLTLLLASLFCFTASKCYLRRARYSNIPNRRILPRPDRLTHIFSEIFINPFIIFAVLFYIVIAVILPFIV